MEDIFKIYSTRQRNNKFRRILIQERGYKCEQCGLSQWQNQNIPLELHHINGNRCDCRKQNLQLLCPNCHALTENYGSKNIQKENIEDKDFIKALKQFPTIRQALLFLGLSDGSANYKRARMLINIYNIKLPKKETQLKEKFCIDCGKPINPNAIRCPECAAKARRETSFTREELKQLIRTTPFTTIGKNHNISDSAVRKWCDKYHLPRTKKEINKYSDDEWKKV